MLSIMKCSNFHLMHWEGGGGTLFQIETETIVCTLFCKSMGYSNPRMPCFWVIVEIQTIVTFLPLWQEFSRSIAYTIIKTTEATNEIMELHCKQIYQKNSLTIHSLVAQCDISRIISHCVHGRCGFDGMHLGQAWHGMWMGYIESTLIP